MAITAEYYAAPKKPPQLPEDHACHAQLGRAPFDAFLPCTAPTSSRASARTTLRWVWTEQTKRVTSSRCRWRCASKVRPVDRGLSRSVGGGEASVILSRGSMPSWLVVASGSTLELLSRRTLPCIIWGEGRTLYRRPRVRGTVGCAFRADLVISQFLNAHADQSGGCCFTNWTTAQGWMGRGVCDVNLEFFLDVQM